MENKKKFIMALSLPLAAMLPACQNAAEESLEPGATGTRLEVNVIGEAGATKAEIVESSTLPADCNFSLWALYNKSGDAIPGGNNALLKYSGSKCTFITPKDGILIPESASVGVYALYPATEEDSPQNVWVYASKQQDVLAGWSAYSNGNFTYATVSNPSVYLDFVHVMSRVTVNFHISDRNPKTYELTPMLGGKNDYAYRYGIYSLINREFVEKSYSDYENLNGTVRNGVKVLSHETKTPDATVDFLVIPSKTIWTVFQKFGAKESFNLPMTNYEAGKQYNFNVNIDFYETDNITVSDVEVKPWTAQTMDGVTIKVK